jgi:hypothetical protein
MAQSTPRPTTRFWPTLQSFKYDGTTHPICLHPYGLEGGQALGTCPTCTIFNASFPSWCSIGDVCCVECSFIGNLYVIFQPTTLHVPTLEIQPKKCTQIQKEWGIDLVWKWQHGVHLCNFATLTRTPPWSLQCFMPWTLTQMMDIGIFSTKWHRNIGIRCMKNSILEHTSTTLGPTCMGKVVYRNVFNMKELPRDVWEFIKVDLQFHGQSFHKMVQDYMFNQIALCTFQILWGLMSLCGFQKHLTKDFKSTTYDVPCSLILQWREGSDKGNVI